MVAMDGCEFDCVSRIVYGERSACDVTAPCVLGLRVASGVGHWVMMVVLIMVQTSWSARARELGECMTTGLVPPPSSR